ncbi:hypothetical protein [Cohnella terricola]|uniref:hypothetical protein n=1 Tax=Cohnella terricola TaxID=1289167 RepID=UPI001648A8E3|nr:hypothetical protein [Cohnella terricola]
MSISESTVVRPFDCPDTCSLNVRMNQGTIVSIDGNPDHLMYPLRRCREVAGLA